MSDGSDAGKLVVRLCVTLLVATLLGCGSGRAVKLVPVRGRVELAGKGVAQLTIQLIPDVKQGTAAPTALGQSDAEGVFHLSTPPHGAGAAPGHYKVTVTGYGSTIPRRYTDAMTTPLSIEVPATGLENWKLELTSP